MKNDSIWIAHGTDRKDADTNLILFTYAGGSPSMFAPWKKLFGEEINMCPVLYPARELRKNEPLPATVKEMAVDFVESNLELFKKEFAFFGHCTGNLVAYEAALYLREKYGSEPLCFIASGSESPRYSRTQNMIMDENGQKLSDEILVEKMVYYGLVPESFAANRNFIDYYIPTYRNDLEMMSAYKYTENKPFRCPFYIMNGKDDKTLRQDAVEDWKTFTSDTTQYNTFDGGHFYLNEIKEVMVDELTNYIKKSKEKKEK